MKRIAVDPKDAPLVDNAERRRELFDLNEFKIRAIKQHAVKAGAGDDFIVLMLDLNDSLARQIYESTPPNAEGSRIGQPVRPGDTLQLLGTEYSPFREMFSPNHRNLFDTCRPSDIQVALMSEGRTMAMIMPGDAKLEDVPPFLVVQTEEDQRSRDDPAPRVPPSDVLSPGAAAHHGRGRLTDEGLGRFASSPLRAASRGSIIRRSSRDVSMERQGGETLMETPKPATRLLLIPENLLVNEYPGEVTKSSSTPGVATFDQWINPDFVVRVDLKREPGDDGQEVVNKRFVRLTMTVWMAKGNNITLVAQIDKGDKEGDDRVQKIREIAVALGSRSDSRE